MGLLSLIKNEETTTSRVTEDLGGLLMEMLRYGHPRVSHLQGGWYSIVEMNTDTVGAKFDIKSEFDHPTPLSAAKECHERIITALKALNK